MTSTYSPAQPGSWLLFAASDTVLFCESRSDISVADLWAAVGGASSVQSVLDLLTSGGLGKTPSFILGHLTGGDLHALVRGALVLEVTSVSGVQTIDGSGVSTWRETTVAGVISIQRVADAQPTLPLTAGVAWAEGFSFSHSERPVETVSRQPAAPAAVTADIPLAPTHTLAEHTIAEREEDRETPSTETVVDAVVESTYGHLFEETVHRSIEDAAVREDVPIEEDPSVVVDDTLHDGETVMSADIAARRGRKKPPVAAAEPTPPAHVLYLELPGNVREHLNQPLVIGRSPSVSQVPGAELPRLLPIPSSPDISRSHARFALEGDSVVVTDLHSRNGTTIALPGKAPQLLRKGEPTTVLPGTVVDLGGGLTLTVRED